MEERLAKAKEQLKKLWSHTTTWQKVLFFSIVLLFFVVFGTSLYLTSKPDLQPLFTNLEASEAGAITEKLTEMGILYEVSVDGKTILVPSKDIPQTRLNIANEGLATGGVVGFELFDETKFGETDTDRRAKFQRALQGELTRTIRQMKEVNDARVHIVIPEPTLFSGEQGEPTASIMLDIAPHRNVNEEQIKGLVRLISSSVEGLKPENVTIIDNNMRSLTEEINFEGGEKSQNKLTANQLEIQSNYQKEMERSAQSMLDKVLGPNKAVVRVSAVLDFDRVERASENYGPNVVRSESIEEEKHIGQNTSNPVGGQPGTDANVPGYQQVDENSSSESEKSSRVRNYEVDKSTEHRFVSPGSVKQMSAAVIVDAENLLPQQQEAIENAIVTALGMQDQRGDQVAVTAMPFNTSYYDEMKQALAEQQKAEMYKQYAMVGLGAIVILGILWALLRKKGEDDIVASDPVKVEALINLQESLDEQERSRMQKEIEQLTKQSPGDVAKLLKTWLAEE